MNQLFDEHRVRTYANLTTNYVPGSVGVPFNSKPGIVQQMPPPPSQQSPQQSGMPMPMSPSPNAPQMLPHGMMSHAQMMAMQSAPSGYPMAPPHMHPGGYMVCWRLLLLIFIHFFLFLCTAYSLPSSSHANSHDVSTYACSSRARTSWSISNDASSTISNAWWCSATSNIWIRSFSRYSSS